MRAGLSVRGGIENINARVRSLARVHKRRRAGRASASIKKGWSIRGRIDGARETLTAVRTKETWHGQF